MTLPNDIWYKTVDFVSEEFENGKGLRGTKLKNYSGPSLEKTSNYILHLIMDDLKIKYPESTIEHQTDYIQSDFEGFSDERVDQHIYINGKIAFLQEDRAWVDKPFYTLKRAVARNLFLSCASKMHSHVKFCILSYCFDIKPEIIATCDYTQGYGERISTYSLTNRRRQPQLNWYDTGYNRPVLFQYANSVYNHLTEVLEFERNKTTTRRLFGVNEPNSKQLNQYDLV